LWRSDSGQLISTLRHGDRVRAVAISPDGKFVLTGSGDSTARLWRADSGQLISTLRHDSGVTAVAFSPDGKSVLTGSRDSTARLWRADSGQLISTLRHDDSVTAVAFSPDGKFVLTGSDNRTARLWRPDSGQLISTLRHGSYVTAVAFSPDGKFVLTGNAVATDNSTLTGDYDCTARLWRADSGQLISTLRHDSIVNAVAFSQDGAHAVVMTDKWIHFSSVTEGGLIHRASRVPGPWRARGFHFDSNDGLRLRIVWMSAGDSIRIDTLRFDAPDAPPIDGDPKELLNDWMKRLALKFDERGKVVSSQPVETVKNER
jgi:WD40 repeat protein